jgi:hypothetical protein
MTKADMAGPEGDFASALSLFPLGRSDDLARLELVRQRSYDRGVRIGPVHTSSILRDCAWPPGQRPNRCARGPSR